MQSHRRLFLAFVLVTILLAVGEDNFCASPLQIPFPCAEAEPVDSWNIVDRELRCLGLRLVVVQEESPHLTELHDVLDDVNLLKVRVTTLCHDALSFVQFQAETVTPFWEHKLHKLAQ